MKKYEITITELRDNNRILDDFDNPIKQLNNINVQCALKVDFDEMLS